LIVVYTLSKYTDNQNGVIPTLNAIPAQVTRPKASILDISYFSESNIVEVELRGIDPCIATGREPNHKSWRARFAELLVPASEEPRTRSPIVPSAKEADYENRANDRRDTDCRSFMSITIP